MTGLLSFMSVLRACNDRFADEELAGLLEDIQTKRSFQY